MRFRSPFIDAMCQKPPDLTSPPLPAYSAATLVGGRLAADVSRLRLRRLSARREYPSRPNGRASDSTEAVAIYMSTATG
jgi:hypothetical protein